MYRTTIANRGSRCQRLIRRNVDKRNGSFYYLLMSHPENPTASPLEAQVAAARDEMQAAMNDTFARLQAMQNAAILQGHPQGARDLVKEMRLSLSVASRAFSLFTELQSGVANAPTTDNAAQFAAPQPQPEPQPRLPDVLDLTEYAVTPAVPGAPHRVRIVAEAVVDESAVPAIEEKAQILQQQLGGIATAGNAKVIIATEAVPEVKNEQETDYLSMELSTLFKQVGLADDSNKTKRGNIVRKLEEKHGITTLRDVLLHGSAVILDTRGLGEGTVAFLRMALNETNLNVTLQEQKPTMKEIIEICPTLADLPAKYYFKDYALALGNRSVAEIIDMSRTMLANLLGKKGQPDLSAAITVQNYLPRVALEFTNAIADRALAEN